MVLWEYDESIESEWDAKGLYEKLKDAYSREFAAAELSTNPVRKSPFSSSVVRSVANYTKRIQAIGFVDKAHVLDAGCGMGQWSYVLSQHNARVSGIDQNQHRIDIASFLNRNNPNTSFSHGNLESLPFADKEFDAIFCYGVFMFTDMPQTLASFKRVLKDDGIIFLNFNTIGHYIHRIQYHTFNDPNEELIKAYQDMVVNFYAQKYKGAMMTLEVLESLLHDIGLKMTHSGYDGELASLPFYLTSFYGFPYITEVLIKKEHS